MTAYRDFTTWFYNLRETRPNAQVAREIRAILATKPAVFGMCEAVGYQLPKVRGYQLIRTTLTESRANIAAYVRNDLRVVAHWMDLKETWDRPHGKGQHPPRSYLVLWVDGVQVIVAHQPQRGVANTVEIQTEGVDAVVRRMAPWTRPDWISQHQERMPEVEARPRFAMADWNRLPGEQGPGPGAVADQIGGRIHGHRIDCGVTVGDIRCTGVSYVTELRYHLRRVPMLSDHKHAVRFDLKVPA